jgi:hypothetical protein
MKLNLQLIIIAACVLACPISVASQNVGIGTNTPLQKLHVEGNTFVKDSISIGIAQPKANLDLRGTALIRGSNTNPFSLNLNSGVEFFLGRSANGVLPSGLTSGDLAFHWGGIDGGFKHLLSTRHSSNSFYENAFDFYVNTSTHFNGTANKLAISVSGAGTNIPNGYLAVGTQSWPLQKFYVNGDAKIENDLTVTGNMNMGYVNLSQDYVINPNSRGVFVLACPNGLQLIGGGGGHPDFNAAVVDVTVHYSGPETNSFASTTWKLIVSNTANSTRTIRVNCICARIN